MISRKTAYVAGFIGSQNFFSGLVEDGSGRLVTGDGHVLVARRCADGVHQGNGLAAVRPENVRLASDEPEAGSNKVRSTIVAIAMLGDTLEFVLQSAGGKEIIARLPRHTGMRLAEGEAVWAHWSRDHMTLFPFENLSGRIHERTPEASAGSG